MTSNQAANPASASVTPGTDPRVHPKVRTMLQKFGMGSHAAAVDVKPEHGLEAMMGFVRVVEGMYEKGFYQTAYDAIGKAEDGAGLAVSLEHAKNPDDGFEVELRIHRPADQGDKLLPAVLYVHGGGQIILHHYNDLHKQWTHDLARRGLVAINVGYRNGVDAQGHHPFPTGLNDCAAAVRYVHENRARLGVSKIVIEGESGGGNLSVATALKLLREGHGNLIDGVYADIPYISGVYGKSDEWKREHGLHSLVDLNGYLLESSGQAVFVALYDPTGKSDTDPLAWPWHATVDDFKGFPPTVVSVDEMDPLRDEGIALARKIAEAGVSVASRVNLGQLHGTEMLKAFVPEMYDMIQGDIKRFSYSL